MPFASGVIAHPGRHRPATFEISPGRHHQQLHRRIEPSSIPGSIEADRLENVALHVLQPKIIGLAEIEIHLPTPIRPVQTQHLRRLLLADRRNHPARIQPVTVGCKQFPIMRRKMHDLRPSSPFPPPIKIPRIKTLPPFSRRSGGDAGHASKDESSDDHGRSVRARWNWSKGIRSSDFYREPYRLILSPCAC